MPAGPVPVPRRKAGKEMGRDVTRKRREKRSDDKSDETRPITVTFLVSTRVSHPPSTRLVRVPRVADPPGDGTRPDEMEG